MPPLKSTLFQNLVDQLPQGAVVFRSDAADPAEFELLYANQRAQTLFDTEISDLTGIPVHKLLQSSQRNNHSLTESFQQVLDTKKEAQVFVQILSQQVSEAITLEATIICVEEDAVALIFGDELPHRNTNQISDLAAGSTQRTKDLERALTFQQKMMATSPDIIHVHDIIDNQVIFANSTVYEAMGYTAEEVLEMGEHVIETLVHPDDLERVLHHNVVLLPQLGDNEIARLEMRVLHKETGEPIWFGATESVFSRDEDGSVRSTIGITRNINAQKQAEADLIRANQELEQFVYSVSHDLRAPVRHIASFAKIIQSREISGLTNKGQKYLEEVLSAAMRLGSMIDELLAYSRTRNAKPEKAWIDSNKLVLDILEASQKSSPHHAITWELTDIPACYADPRMMRQIWENLISNAVKYSSKKARTEIRIQAKEKNNELLFSIQDNGAGFDQKYSSQLFTVFQRLHDSTDFPGHGIGLANVARMLEHHDGRIWGEGIPEKGATFYFTLPIG